jgi:hypothetical protein
MTGVIAKTEEEWAEKVRAYLKAELKKADVGYVELAKALKKHGFKDETFSAAFLLATLCALEAEGVRLEDI